MFANLWAWASTHPLQFAIALGVAFYVITGTAQQVGAIRTLIDGLRGYPLCDCPTHGTNTEGALLPACPCTSRTSTNAACPYLTTHDARIESNVLRAEQESTRRSRSPRLLRAEAARPSN